LAPELPLVLPERYRLLEQLGEGATCHVYKAQDALLGHPVAIKVVRPNLAIHARFRARFDREVALSAQVVHPRVIPVFDVGRLDDGRPFVTLACADSGSLSDLLDTQPTLTEALRLIDQVLEALAAMHAMGLVHQDLKPANVLLHQRQHREALGPVDAWVADLGVAGAMAELALHQRGISGTPTWMAPEQRDGRYAELGPWTDLYAVGLMLFEILGGDRRTKAGKRRVLDVIPKGPLGLAREVPPALELVVRNLLDPDPRQRYDRAADVRRALHSALIDTELTMRAAPQAGGQVGQSFSEVILPEGMEAITSAPPVNLPESQVRWNRVARQPMPAEPPSLTEQAAGPSGISMFGLHEPTLDAREGIRWLLWQKAREVVQTGEPRVILLTGSAGTGKTRSADQVARQLEAEGHMEAIFLRYHSPAGPDDGYRGAVQELLAPWNENRADLQQRLKRWLSRDQQRPAEEVDTEASVLARWCGYLEEGETPVNAAVGLAYLYRYLDARAWRGGAIMVLEDVHLAQEDGDGLSICTALLDRSVGERPILAIATLSAEAMHRDPALQAKVAALEARGALRLSLPRMSQTEMEAFLADRMGIDNALGSQLLDFCQGSPARALLVLRDWAVRGYLEQGKGRSFGLAEDVQLDQILPPDIDALYQGRLQGAVQSTEDPKAAFEALAATALAGQEPPLSVVHAVNPEGLDALLATGIIRQRGWRLVFEHGRLAVAARQIALGRPDVADLHRRLGEAWANLAERTGADVDLPMGIHRLHSGSPNTAVVPLLRAARRALDEGRTPLALDAARLGMAAADRTGALSARAEARLRLAEAHLDMDRPEESRRVLETIQEIGHLDRRTKAWVWVFLSRADLAQGSLTSARQYLESAQVAFDATRDREGLIHSNHGLGTLCRIEGNPSQAASHYARMLRLSIDDPRIEVKALRGLVEARVVGGRIEGVDALVHRLRQAALTSGDTRNIAQATYCAGLVHLARRSLPEAERHFHTARALSATIGDDRLQLLSEKNLGEVYRHRGDIRNAERFYEMVVRFASDRDWAGSAAVGQINLALVHMERSAPRMARICIEQAEAQLQARPKHWAWMFIGLMRAVWAAQEGDERTCRAWWAVANERGLGRIQSQDLLIPLRQLVGASQHQGWMDIASRAERTLEQLTLVAES
jgi:eukaryotic-like serine/threonine-protein kinase